MPKTLFGRNALLILGLMALAQLAGVIVFRELVQKPRTAQLADLASDYVSGVVAGLEALAPESRQQFLSNFGASGKVEIVSARERGPEGHEAGNPLWRDYARMLAERLHKQPDEVVWSGAEQGSLWVSVPIAEQDYWLIIRGLTAGMKFPSLALLVSLLILLLAVGGAFLIQRRLNRPLTRLVDSARAVARGQQPEPLSEEPPEEIATVARAFNQMTRSLAAIEQERSVMLAGVSHDLRTPLSKVRLAIEIMAERAEPELLAGMRVSLAQIDGIIDQFLDYGRASTGESAEILDLNELLRQAVVSRPRDEPRFALSLTDLPPVSVRPHSLQRAIVNLMDNAVRYGRAPFAITTTQSTNGIQIAVSDSGSGIPAEEMDVMKQPFRRGSAARSGPPGSGLGLAIVERVALLHRGSLQLRNRSEGGFEAAIQIASQRTP